MYKCKRQSCRHYEEAKYAGSFASRKYCHFDKEKARRVDAGFSCPIEELKAYQREQIEKKRQEQKDNQSWYVCHDQPLSFE